MQKLFLLIVSLRIFLVAPVSGGIVDREDERDAVGAG